MGKSPLSSFAMRGLLLLLSIAAGCQSMSVYSGSDYTESNCYDQKQAIVHLFEGHWDWIADECEKVLGPKGFCGVQVSPPMEHIQGGQWWTRYQPVSYKIESRSGNRGQFESMVQRCNSAGVIVIVDAVINHMTGHGASGTGTGGSGFDGASERYDGVPFSSQDFHQPYCEINNYGNSDEVRNCYLVGLNDLDGGKQYVREKVSGYYNDVINTGVRGFRVDASKHMWPGDLEAIQGMTQDIGGGGRPLFFHEVIDMGGEAISSNQINGNPAFHNDWQYKVAVAFMLGHDYGFKRIMSSYYFQDTDQGPPGGAPDSFPNACGNGWTCEHRWSSIMNMAQFANKVIGQPITNWDASGTTLGFARGNVGFLAVGDLGKDFNTGLPDGEYCDIIRDCSQKIQISGGRGYFNSPDDDPVVAICVGC